MLPSLTTTVSVLLASGRWKKLLTMYSVSKAAMEFIMMVATDSEVRFRPANSVGSTAHSAPAAKPASRASSQPQGAGSGTVRPTMTAARPPTSTCPSPPMLNTPL